MYDIIDKSKKEKNMEQKYLFECENCGIKFRLGSDAVELKYGVPYKAKDGR